MTSGRRTFALALVLAFAAAGASCDPVRSDAIDALGGEAPNVRKGPLHRPGQPCLTCHGGALGDPPQFTVAGTVYVNQGGTTPAAGAVVTVTNADGTTSRGMKTNAAGNFYASPKEFSPVYPLRVLVTYLGAEVSMTSSIGRDGSCADCHADPAGPNSAGHIFVVVPDGGTP